MFSGIQPIDDLVKQITLKRVNEYQITETKKLNRVAQAQKEKLATALNQYLTDRKHQFELPREQFSQDMFQTLQHILQSIKDMKSLFHAEGILYNLLQNDTFKGSKNLYKVVDSFVKQLHKEINNINMPYVSFITLYQREINNDCKEIANEIENTIHHLLQKEIDTLYEKKMSEKIRQHIRLQLKIYELRSTPHLTELTAKQHVENAVERFNALSNEPVPTLEHDEAWYVQQRDLEYYAASDSSHSRHFRYQTPSYEAELERIGKLRGEHHEKIRHAERATREAEAIECNVKLRNDLLHEQTELKLTEEETQRANGFYHAKNESEKLKSLLTPAEYETTVQALCASIQSIYLPPVTAPSAPPLSVMNLSTSEATFRQEKEKAKEVETAPAALEETKIQLTYTAQSSLFRVKGFFSGISGLKGTVQQILQRADALYAIEHCLEKVDAKTTFFVAQTCTALEKSLDAIIEYKRYTRMQDSEKYQFRECIANHIVNSIASESKEPLPERIVKCVIPESLANLIVQHECYRRALKDNVAARFQIEGAVTGYGVAAAAAAAPRPSAPPAAASSAPASVVAASAAAPTPAAALPSAPPRYVLAPAAAAAATIPAAAAAAAKTASATADPAPAAEVSGPPGGPPMQEQQRRKFVLC